MRYAPPDRFRKHFTKVTAIDLISEEIIGTASLSTADSDIERGRTLRSIACVG